MYQYIVQFDYWQSGSGYSHSEYFENDKSEEIFTAKEWWEGFLDSMTEEEIENLDVDAINCVTVRFYADDDDPMFDKPVSVSEYVP